MSDKETQEKKSFHNPCPYGNDECPKCAPQSTLSEGIGKEIGVKCGCSSILEKIKGEDNVCELHTPLLDQIPSFSEVIRNAELSLLSKLREKIENYKYNGEDEGTARASDRIKAEILLELEVKE